MLQVGNISAWVSIDGIELTQYSIENYGFESSCWIASEVGKKFAVHWKYESLPCDLRAAVYIDGQKCDSILSSRSRLPKERYVDAVPTSGKSERPLMFSVPNTTDDEEYLAMTNPVTGEIKVEVHECEITAEVEFENSNSHFTGAGKVHEKSKKALGHQVGLGEERISRSHDRVEVDDGDKVATFLFRYRPIEFLQADGIAPSAVTDNSSQASSSRKRSAPTDDSVMGDSESQNDEEIKALQETELQLQSQLRAVQEQLNKRRKTAKIKSEVGVKMEPGLVKWESDVSLDGEIIDLT
ncbi:hypothetical protein VKT23_008255 [Stygiomarasmius scandens]|uniref:DUF7918 domain-containing protein n=1 Tax=Marasmiellus scandens TaxID=2682957 RepID=A0ABR1JNW2_9AGAR